MRFAFERSEKPQAAINSPIGAFDLTSRRLSSEYLILSIASCSEHPYISWKRALRIRRERPGTLRITSSALIPDLKFCRMNDIASFARFPDNEA